MLAVLLQAIAMASRPDSTEPLRQEHLVETKPRPPPRKNAVPKKQPRKWKGVFEHKDTPLHKRSKD